MKYERVLDTRKPDLGRSFAKFGGRNVETNGPVQYLGAKLRRLLASTGRGQDSDRDNNVVQISLAADENGETSGSRVDMDPHFVISRCVSAQQHGVGSPAPAPRLQEDFDTCATNADPETCDVVCQRVWSGSILDL